MITTDNIKQLIIEKIKEEWVLAGHPTTGAFEESLESEELQEDNKTIINILGYEYGIYMDEGVPADRIPYTRRKRGQGRGGKSRYITGLHNWVKLKLGISDEREALSVAFAIAHKHSIDGIEGSGFLKEMREKYNQEIDEMIGNYLDEIMIKNM